MLALSGDVTRSFRLHAIKLFAQKIKLCIFFYLGFALVFSIMEPVPRAAKIMFHVYGFGGLILAIVSSVYSFQASACVSVPTSM